MSKIIKERLFMRQISCSMKEGILIRAQGFNLLEIIGNI